MTVRFLPSSEPPQNEALEGAELAEIISLREQLVTRNESPQEPEPGCEGAREGAREFATRTLARKAMSSGELHKKMQEAEYSADEIEAVIEEFHVSLYLDDLGLARIVADKLRTNKKASAGQIRLALQKRAFPQSTIAEVLESIDADEETALLREAALKQARKLLNVDRQTATRRLYGFLQRRGWSGSELSRAITDAFAELDS